jgi:hypothetical protein
VPHGREHCARCIHFVPNFHALREGGGFCRRVRVLGTGDMIQRGGWCPFFHSS